MIPFLRSHLTQFLPHHPGQIHLCPSFSLRPVNLLLSFPHQSNPLHSLLSGHHELHLSFQTPDAQNLPFKFQPSDLERHETNYNRHLHRMN
ncbi:hypothetical protein BLNAU_2416 [Blattamonas nauphoetae]|uniref:Uncharacterized protein n=1 Tax=Blattamonas nauphoetae TaxID=2049346 RepID=A0ABQ9YG75_9EUKA|nr:hypothetical protein BLNAU_2416 [Blattamonas nauphoetae]